MWSLLLSRFRGRKLEEMPALLVSTTGDVLQEAVDRGIPEAEESTLLKTVGWVSAGFGAVAIGLFVGRELRQRYKFNRRTPYDFYAHSASEDSQDMEFGVGI